jgi:hypothetical protein
MASSELSVQKHARIDVRRAKGSADRKPQHQHDSMLSDPRSSLPNTHLPIDFFGPDFAASVTRVQRLGTRFIHL